MTDADRRIAHLDMDAFYASVELLSRPELADRPVAIGGAGDPSARGVVTTANYAARRFGIRSGMALRRARELCPDCVFLPADFDRYRSVSRTFKAAVIEIAPVMEDRGIDEIYLDLGDVAGVEIERGAVLGRRLKAAVRAATGLTCSIGIAPNKQLAKLASDMEKPDGLTIIEHGDLESRIWPLAVRRINGIGPKAEAKLTALGIRTIGELAAAPPTLLHANFGARYASFLREAAHGRDDRPVVTDSEPVSFSRETTVETDLHLRRDRQAVAAILARLCQGLAEDLARRGYVGRTIGIKLRYDDFRHVTRETTCPVACADAATIRRVAFGCLARAPQTRRIRLVGVRMGKLARAGEAANADATPTRVGENLDLFQAPE